MIGFYHFSFACKSVSVHHTREHTRRRLTPADGSAAARPGGHVCTLYTGGHDTTTAAPGKPARQACAASTRRPQSAALARQALYALPAPSGLYAHLPPCCSTMTSITSLSSISRSSGVWLGLMRLPSKRKRTAVVATPLRVQKACDGWRARCVRARWCAGFSC